MPIFDLICPKCETRRDDEIIPSRFALLTCERCGEEMKIAASSLRSSFAINGYSYKNHYGLKKNEQ